MAKFRISRRLQFFALVWVAIGGSGILSAQEGLFNVEELDRLSSIIVVGTIYGGADGQLSLAIDRVLKGTESLGAIATVTWLPSHSNGCDVASPIPPVHGIWFLQSKSDKTLQFAQFMNSQVCHPSHPDYETPAGPLQSGLSYGSNDPVKYKLAVELASALLASPSMPIAIERYPGVFGGLDSSDGEPIGKALETSSSKSVQMIGNLTLIRLGSTDGLILLKSELTKLAQTPLPAASDSTNISDAVYKSQIADAISDIHGTAPQVVSVLGTIASNSNQDIVLRRAASRALRNIHTARATVAIAPLVDDPDAAISTYAVSGLSCYANAVPVLDDDEPGRNLNLNNDGPLKTNDTLDHFVIGAMGDKAASYKSYWTQWWLGHESTIQKAADAEQSE